MSLDAYTIDAHRGAQIKREIDVFNKVLPILFRRHWVLLKAPANSGGFVTSDHPFTLLWSDPKMRGGFYGPGLGMPSTEAAFPISPSLAVIGTFEGQNGERRIDEFSVAAFNGAIITFAERQVYARDQDFFYAMHEFEIPKPASQLITDHRFLQKDEPDGNDT
jgi:hypothetical protein